MKWAAASEIRIGGTGSNRVFHDVLPISLGSSILGPQGVLLRLSEKLKKGELKNTKNNFSVR